MRAVVLNPASTAASYTRSTFDAVTDAENVILKASIVSATDVVKSMTGHVIGVRDVLLATGEHVSLTVRIVGIDILRTVISASAATNVMATIFNGVIIVLHVMPEIANLVAASAVVSIEVKLAIRADHAGKGTKDLVRSSLAIMMDRMCRPPLTKENVATSHQSPQAT